MYDIPEHIDVSWFNCVIEEELYDLSAGIRLFGFLGAGATLGQLAGSATAGILAHAAQSGSRASGAVGLHLSLMTLAAILLEVAGRLVMRLKRPMNAVDDGGRSAEAGMSGKVTKKQ